MGRDIGDPFDIGVHIDICVLIFVFFISVFFLGFFGDSVF